MLSGVLTSFRVLGKRIHLERSCRWSRAQLDAHQANELARLRRFAYERSPFYRRFHRGLENRPLSELPILTKSEMMENFDDLVTDRSVRLREVDEWLSNIQDKKLFRGRYLVLSTSGSTGRRGVFLFDDREWISVLGNASRPMVWAGVIKLTKPPRMAIIASRTPWHYSARVTASLSNRLLASLHLDAGEPLANMVRCLNDFRPTMIGIYPSVLRQLADEQIAGRLRIQPIAIMSAAEVLTNEVRLLARQAWGLQIYDTYGATEYSPIAAECSFGRRHLLEDGAIIELVDDRGRAVAPGESSDRVLLTVFGRRTQPLIRYEISDVLRPEAGECECGRKFRLIANIEGRLEDILVFPRRGKTGETVCLHPNLFHEILEAVPATGWQVVQNDHGVAVNLTGLKDPMICEALTRRMQELFSIQEAEVKSIAVRSVEALQRGATGKAPLVMAQTAGRPIVKE